MFISPIVAAAVQVHASSSDLGINGSVLIYLGSFALFGLVGLVPLLAGKPPAKSPAPQWTVVTPPDRRVEPAAQVEATGLTIDAEFTVVNEPLRVTGQNSRWGR